MRIPHPFTLATSLFALTLGASAADANWAFYLGDKSTSHYSPLAQITRGNLHQLEPAWIYHSGGADVENRSQIQCNPLIIGGCCMVLPRACNCLP